MNQLVGVLWNGIPLLVSLSTFAGVVLMGEELTASRIFTSLALFNILRFPMIMFPNAITNIIEAGVSLRRIHRFLISKEVKTLLRLRL